MKLIDVSVNVPYGYGVCQRPIEWSKVDDCFKLVILDVDKVFPKSKALTDYELLKLIESFEINNWLLNQSARLRGVTDFKIGVYLNEAHHRSRPNVSSETYELYIEKRNTYAFYLIPTPKRD